MNAQRFSVVWACWLLAALAAPAAEPAAATWKNHVGLQLVAAEDADGLGYALYGSRNLSARDRLFLQLEWQEFDDSRRWEDDGWTYRAQSTIDSSEIEFGYLRRLTPADRNWGFHVGPSLGVTLADGSFSSRATLDGDGGTEDDDGSGEADPGEDDDETDDGRKTAKDAGGAAGESGDVELDPGLAVYAVALADYDFSSHVGVLAAFSYGYAFERDGKFKYDGGRGSESFTLDDDFFWNFAVGVAFAF